MDAKTLFIADLHLCESRPAIVATFERFLAGPAREAHALYILGDLFEYWPGDDAAALPFYAGVAAQLRALSSSGVALFLTHGNRDFLIGAKLAAAIGATLLDDPFVMDLHGTRTCLMHGDTLCTDDVDYQRFRAKVRDIGWQREFLAAPLTARIETAEALRRQSIAAKGQKEETIMDVNAAAVAAVFRQSGCRRLIHGHTHRPATHRLDIDGIERERWVLNDWYREGGYLECKRDGCRQVWLARPVRIP